MSSEYQVLYNKDLLSVIFGHCNHRYRGRYFRVCKLWKTIASLVITPNIHDIEECISRRISLESAIIKIKKNDEADLIENICPLLSDAFEARLDRSLARKRIIARENIRLLFNFAANNDIFITPDDGCDMVKLCKLFDKGDIEAAVMFVSYMDSTYIKKVKEEQLILVEDTLYSVLQYISNRSDTHTEAYWVIKKWMQDIHKNYNISGPWLM